jgi:DNA-binding protein HU-beta
MGNRPIARCRTIFYNPARPARRLFFEDNAMNTCIQPTFSLFYRVYSTLRGNGIPFNHTYKKDGFKMADKKVKPMTKQQLVSEMADKLGVSKKDVGTYFDLLAETAFKETKRKGEFTLPGFGKLVKVHRKARMGRNPATGETIKIKAKTVVKFRVAKAVKDAVLG